MDSSERGLAYLWHVHIWRSGNSQADEEAVHWRSRGAPNGQEPLTITPRALLEKSWVAIAATTVELRHQAVCLNVFS